MTVNPDSGGSNKFFKEGGGRKTIYQLRPHLSQMRTTKYMPISRKKRLFEKIWANGGNRRPHFLPFESATESGDKTINVCESKGAWAEWWWCAFLRQLHCSPLLCVSFCLREINRQSVRAVIRSDLASIIKEKKRQVQILRQPPPSPLSSPATNQPSASVKR